MRVINQKEIQKLYEEVSPDLKPKIINPNPDYAYVWVQKHHQMLTNYINMGCTIVTKSDVTVEGLKPTVDNQWESGVDILMMIPKAKRDKILERARKIAELQMSGLRDDFHNRASNLGLQSVEVGKDEDGEIKIHK